MSSWSDSAQCARCDGINLMVYGENKPYESVSGECLDCGFSYSTQERQMSLEEVNERRADYGRSALKKLREVK